jgi:hypothetical protein
METGISDVIYLPDFNSIGSQSPAIVNRETGQLYINRSVWQSIPFESRLFILLHEAGHASLQTRSEHEADAYAFQAYAQLGYPLSKSVLALSRVLKFNKPEDIQRLENQLGRAAAYDYFTNKNQKAKKMIMPGHSLYLGANGNPPLFSSANGDEELMGPPEFDYGTWDEKANPGGKINNWLNNISDGLQGLADVYSTVKNGGILSGHTDNVPPPPPVSEKSNTTLWVVVAVVSLVVLGAVIYFAKSKN